MNTLIVGLSGVTNGGKTTLAKNLLKVLPFGTKLVKQDDYYLPEDSPLHVPSPGGIKHHNWDVISSLDMDSMAKDIGRILATSQGSAEVDENESYFPYSCPTELDLSPDFNLDYVKNLIYTLHRQKGRKILLIDGFTLYDDPRFRTSCELKFFLTLPKDECFARRRLRSYEPPDPPGYFEACLWPMYEAHLKRVEQVEGVRFYDGTVAMEEIFSHVLREIVSAAIS